MKIKTMLVGSLFCATVAMAQTSGIRETTMPLPQSPMDAQIQAVHQNYEAVKAHDEAVLRDRQQAAQEQARKAKQREAAKAKAAANQRAAAAKEQAARRAKLEKRADESAELDLEMKRLQVQRMKSQVNSQGALDEARGRKADAFIDAELEAVKKGNR